jgi:purine-cytosine permease-like protein
MKHVNLYWLWLAVALPCIGVPLAMVAFAVLMTLLHNTMRLGTVGTSERLRFGLGSLLIAVAAVAVALAGLRSSGALEPLALPVVLSLVGYALAAVVSVLIARHLQSDGESPFRSASDNTPLQDPPEPAEL